MAAPNILIVEDEAITAMDIKQTLIRLKFRVAGIVSRGIDAVNFVKEKSTDLILMDITIKGDLDGIETAAIISRSHNIPIVYLSAHFDEETIERSRTTNPYGYILKPLNERDLNSCIRMSLFRFEAEKKLNESESRFKALTEVAQTSIIIIQENKFIYANPFVKELTGYSSDEMLQMSFWDIVHPDQKNMVKERGFARQRGEDVPAAYEFIILTKSGESKWVQTSAILTEFDGKKCVLAVVYDITERKKAEDILRQSEEKFRAVAESTPAQIVIFQGDRFVYVNSYSETITGYSQEELLNMDFWALAHPDDIEVTRQRGKARLNGESVTENYELRIITKSKQEKWLSYSARTIEYEGKTAVLGIAIDISESKKIQEEIEQSRQRYRAFIAQSTEGIYRTEALKPIPVDLDLDNQIDLITKGFYIAECNEVMAQMYGVNSASELIGRKVSDFLLPDENANHEMIKLFIDNGYKLVDAESKEENSAGNTVYFSNNAVGIVENGHLKRIWGIQKDITNRKKIDEKLKENIEYSTILNYFTSSMLKQNTVQEILWDITQNCFSRLSFVDCSIFLLDERSGKLVQRAAYGRKNPKGFDIINPLILNPGEGIIGSVALTGEAEIINDTSVDKRYIADDEIRLSEIAVPIINEGKVIGVIDSEHHEKSFFNEFHLNILKSIASLCSIKIVQVIAQEKVKKSEERYRTFVEQSSEGIYRLEFSEPVPVDLEVDQQIELLQKSTYIAECNDVFARMYEKEKADELIGKKTNELKFVNINETGRDRKFISQNYNIFEEESVEMDHEGNIHYFMTNAVGVIDSGFLTSIWGVQRDITGKKKSEEALRRSLNEKEILLKEIHHRVKNNLQIVTSLLKLQSSYVNDEKVKLLFKESQNRVQSMSLIHQKLYQTKDLAKIDFRDYIETVATHLQHSFGILEDRVSVSIEVKDLFMSIDNAIPAGLIINELVSNSLKHAFPGVGGGSIYIHAAFDEFKNEYWLVIRDNGVGIPENIDIKNSNSFGLKLVSTLVEQMSGTIELVTIGGCEFRINLKSADYKDRS
jgi:PAS domain S-box-containing protein